MNNQLQTFIDYLLDTETTSEIAFIENIQTNNEFFQSRYLKDWEHTVHHKLQQVHPNAITSTLNNVDNGHKLERTTTGEGEEDGSGSAILSSSSSSEEEDEDDEEKENQNATSSKNQNVHRTSKTTDIYVDPIRQCQRLLRLLHYCQQQNSHFTDLYFHTLEQCMKSDNDKFISVVLQQIASDVFEGSDHQNDYQRLITARSSSTISSTNRSILATIQTLSTTNKTERNTTSFLSQHIDTLYPYTACFLDVRREFRDTAHYLIDGDSLLLSIAHHINVNLNSYYGNTLHVIFLIERLLLTLFQQSHQCNYTLVFFDCHYHLYQQHNSILSLLRTCLIAHLSKNTEKVGRTKFQRFPSWYADSYLQFVREEKPMFILYHDLSTFDLEHDQLLSKDVLENLLCVYRLFGN